MQVDQVQAPVHYLDESIQPRRLGTVFKEHIEIGLRYFKGYMRSLFYVATHPKIDQGYTASSRWECFRQAVHLIHVLRLQERETRKSIDHIHAHFAHDPTLIAYLVYLMIDLPYSFTAHARDLYQVPEDVLMDRIRASKAVITCCGVNVDYLNQIGPSEQPKFSLIYHGVNLEDFRAASNNSVHPPSDVPLILSVGRLVEKKGFLDLLQALCIVKERGMRFKCTIYGDGPLAQVFEKWIEEHDMADDVQLMGDITQQKLISIYQSATLFALTPMQTEDGDRDGIPNVLLEAMAVGLPVVTTAVAGIPELVDHNENGLLYQPHDVDGISSGILELLKDAEKRRQFGKAGSKKVNEQFDIALAANRLKTLFT